MSRKPIIYITLFLCAFALGQLNRGQPKPPVKTYVIACHTSEGKTQCIKDAEIFICSGAKRKKFTNNDVYSNCIKHKVSEK